jgi:hypothetical protein
VLDPWLEHGLASFRLRLGIHLHLGDLRCLLVHVLVAAQEPAVLEAYATILQICISVNDLGSELQ